MAKSMLPEDKNMIAYCGLDCSQCAIYKTDISGKAKALRRELHAAKLKKLWHGMYFLGDYESFKKTLDGLAILRCVKACRGGGGNPWCNIRKCCQKKSLWSCGECNLIKTCKKLAAITKNYNGKNLKNLK